MLGHEGHAEITIRAAKPIIVVAVLLAGTGAEPAFPILGQPLPPGASQPAPPAASAAAPKASTLGMHSFYTDLKLDDCSITETNDFGTIWACPGYRGIPVMVAEDDLRFMVSYGLKSTEERAASQTLPPLNSLGQTIEWRVSNKAGRWKPYATIIRYLIDAHEDKNHGEVLAVTRVAEGATCQIAFVDALANADANELARQAADAHGFDFDCSKEPEIVGKFGAW